MLCLSIVLILLSLGITFLLAFLYVLSTAVKAKHKNAKAKHVVVLGKKLSNNSPDKEYYLRLNRALSIAAIDPNKQIYILGGITGKANISESKAGQRYLENNKILTSHIHVEEKSCDTLENMKQLKTNTAISEKDIALITNRYHLARASLMASGFDFDVEKCAAEDVYKPGVLATLILLAEAFYLHWYLTGRDYARLTRNQRMLSRVQ